MRRSADVCPSQTDRNDGLSDPSSASKAPAAASSHAVPGAPRGHSPPSVREAPPWGTRGPQAPSCSPLASLGISATGSLHAPCKWASPRGCRQPPLGRPQLTGSSGSRTLGAATRRSGAPLSWEAEWGRGAALGRRGAGSKPWGPRPRGRRHVTRAWLQRRRWEALADVCRLETVSSAGLRKCREWSSDPTCEEFGSRHAVLTSDASTLAPLGPRGAASRKGGEPLLFWGPQSLGSQTASSSSGQLAPNKPGSDPYSQDWGPQLPCSSSAGGASPHPERRSRGGRSRRRGGGRTPRKKSLRRPCSLGSSALRRRQRAQPPPWGTTLRQRPWHRNIPTFQDRRANLPAGFVGSGHGTTRVRACEVLPRVLVNTFPRESSAGVRAGARVCVHTAGQGQGACSAQGLAKPKIRRVRPPVGAWSACPGSGTARCPEGRGLLGTPAA